MGWIIKEKGLWTCCSSFMKGGVPVFPRFTLTGDFRIGDEHYFYKCRADIVLPPLQIHNYNSVFHYKLET